MAKKTPLQQVNDLFGNKEKLVDKLMGMVERDKGESKDELKARLTKTPNSKLLRLFNNLTEINDTFGGKDKFIDAILQRAARSRDQDYRDKLMSYRPNRLMDLYRSQKAGAPSAQA